MSTYIHGTSPEEQRRLSLMNDVLQYLGAYTFRSPVPAYRHNAAMWFELRGWAATDATPLGAQRRPDADRDVLWTLAERLDALEAAP